MAQCTPSSVPRRACLMLLIGFTIVFTMGLIFLNQSFARNLRSHDMEASIAVMRTRLKFLESQYQGRQQDVADEQARVDDGCRPQPMTENNVPSTTYPPQLLALLKEISGSKASDGLLSSDRPELIKAPFSLRIMPHLSNHPDSLRPAYQLRSSRQFSDYIIGIPHVKRDKEIYLFRTIQVLLEKMTKVDKNLTMIVVMVGDTNLTYVVETAHNIEKKFPDAIEAGLINVISPHRNYYPDLNAIPLTLGDSKKRVKWRTKQNLDAIYLMAFAHTRCLYYLMIEDDVLASDNYMTQIRKYTTEVTITNPDWFFIQYSTTGGIGKLFRSTDLVHFMTYVQLFFYNMPIDWLTESYLADRKCGINKGAKECAIAKSRIRPTYKKNLFKHIGLYSSLKGKLQNVKFIDRNVSGNDNLARYTSNWMLWYRRGALPRYRVHDYKDANAQGMIPEFYPHDNPPVSYIKCDVEHHLNHTIQNAYNGLSYFWGKVPRQNDVIEFWFETPGKIQRYLIRSTNLKHVNDKIYFAAFEILPVANTRNGTFLTIDYFDEFGMVEGQVDISYGDLYAMRIRFEKTSDYWVSITEIEFVHMDDNVYEHYKRMQQKMLSTNKN